MYFPYLLVQETVEECYNKPLKMKDKTKEQLSVITV